MKRIETFSPSPESLLADFKREHIRFQFYHFQGTIRPHLAAGDAVWTPPIDCYDTPLEVVIEMNLAGLASGEVQIRFGSHTIQISGERRESAEEAPRRYHILEIERGKFERTIELPVAIDCKLAEATFESGMLCLRIPRVFGNPFAGCGSAGSIKDFDEF
jgi:HSP20 family molecular chaperone IbpA